MRVRVHRVIRDVQPAAIGAHCDAARRGPRIVGRTWVERIWVDHQGLDDGIISRVVNQRGVSVDHGALEYVDQAAHIEADVRDVDARPAGIGHKAHRIGIGRGADADFPDHALCRAVDHHDLTIRGIADVDTRARRDDAVRHPAHGDHGVVVGVVHIDHRDRPVGEADVDFRVVRAHRHTPRSETHQYRPHHGDV